MHHSRNFITLLNTCDPQIMLRRWYPEVRLKPDTTYYELSRTLRTTDHLRCAQQQTVLRCNAGGNRLRPDAIALLLQVHRARDIDRNRPVDPARQSAGIT